MNKNIKKSYLSPHKCPVCQSDFCITELECIGCGSQLRGRFRASPLASLSDEHQRFVSLFVACRGNMKEMERALNLSYPTIRNELERVIAELGFHDKGDDAQKPLGVLERLQSGEISVDDAMRAINKESAGP